jgi:hypothetical protein
MKLYADKKARFVIARGGTSLALQIGHRHSKPVLVKEKVKWECVKHTILTEIKRHYS